MLRLKIEHYYGKHYSVFYKLAWWHCYKRLDYAALLDDPFSPEATLLPRTFTHSEVVEYVRQVNRETLIQELKAVQETYAEYRGIAKKRRKAILEQFHRQGVKVEHE